MQNDMRMDRNGALESNTSRMKNGSAGEKPAKEAEKYFPRDEEPEKSREKSSSVKKKVN